MAVPVAIDSIGGAGPVASVRMTGELDMDNADDAIDRLLGLVPEDAEGLVVDLGGVTYVDSAGIRLFVDLSERLARTGRKLALAVPAEAPISRIFALVRLELVVPLYETAEAAATAVALRADEGLRDA